MHAVADGRRVDVVTIEDGSDHARLTIANVQRFTGTSLGTAVRLASRNPARMMGMSHLFLMAPGAPANFNVFDQTGARTGSILHGRLIE